MQLNPITVQQIDSLSIDKSAIRKTMAAIEELQAIHAHIANQALSEIQSLLDEGATSEEIATIRACFTREFDAALQRGRQSIPAAAF